MMKKLLCLMLCICIACPLGLVNVLAQNVHATTTPTVLFENDHEVGTTVGDFVPAKENTLGMWTSRTESATSTIKIAQDETQGKVAMYANSSTTNGGPRLHKSLYLGDDVTDMTISYKVKTQSASLSLSFRYDDGKEQSFYSLNSSSWADVKVVYDFVNKTYTTYKNGAKVGSGELTGNSFGVLSVRFSTSIVSGRYAYLDDVVITTSCDVNPEECNNSYVGLRTPEEIIAPFASYPHAPMVSTPAGKYEMFNYDCSLNSNNGISGGTDALWSKSSLAEPGILNADAENNGKVMRLTNDQRVKQTGYLGKKLAIGTSVKEVGVEYYTALSKSATYVDFRDAKNNILVSASNYAISETTNGAVAGGWNKIKAVFDIENSLMDLYVNDTPVASDIAFTSAYPAADYEASVYVYGALDRADTMLLDNFVIYQDAAPTMDSVKYYGVTGTTWSLVANDVVLTEDSFVNNLKQHPRIMLNSREEIVNKINSDARVAGWYTSIKTSADKLLTTAPCEYKYGNGRNILDVAREIGERLWKFSLVYLVEQDDAYVERAILEMRNAATFPDWSNNAPIIPSEIMLGFAGFYDWCYNSPVMTDEIKAEMVQIIKDQALWQFVRSYDGVISAEIAGGSSNRTTVSNSASALLALAIADEYPQLSEYLLTKALQYMRSPTNAYGSDGAYPEGVSYWAYPMRTITPVLSALTTAFTDDFTLPESAQWYFDHEALNNTNDYWAYASGAVENFDFGDASPGLSATSAIYWFAQKTNDPFHSWYANYIADKTNSNVTSTLFAIPWYDVEFEAYNDGTMPLDKTFDANPKAQIASMRSSWSADGALYAALQGGYNGTGHMFKSLGTFVIDANGQRFVRTAGRSNYSALYDASMYYGRRAEGQNTIIANPGEDWDQVENAYATFIAHEEAENEAFTVLDMTETNKAFTDAKRGMYMTPGRRSIVIQDEVTTSFPSELWWFVHTEADIVLAEDGKSAMLYKNGERMYVCITEGPEDAKLTTMPSRPLPTSPIAPDDEYPIYDKLAIHLEDVSQMTLAVEFIPIAEGEAAPAVCTPVKPIAEWSVSDDTIPVNRQAGANLVFLAGSPNALALEQKKMIDKEMASIVPFVENGVCYVPVQFAADAYYAKSSVSTSAASITYRAVTTDLTQDIVVKNDVVYAPATKIAQALGKELYTDDTGLIVFSDMPQNYTEETKSAIRTQLGTRVVIAGEDFEAFDIDKTSYELRYTTKMPRVKVYGATQETKNDNVVSFVLDGETYTITFVEDVFKDSIYNFALGLVPTADQRMGSSYIIENMTDGDLSAGTAGTAATTGTTNITNVTFELEFGGVYYIDSIRLIDQQTSAGSTLDKATWYARTAAGEWVQIGVHEDLTQGMRSGNTRTNDLAVGDGESYTALRVKLENTDDYTQRYFITELMVLGNRVAMDLTPYSDTTVEIAGDDLAFTTVLENMPTSGYVVTALYKEGVQVGLKILPFTTSTTLDYTLPNTDFDEIKVMVIESFQTMRIMTDVETVGIY